MISLFTSYVLKIKICSETIETEKTDVVKREKHAPEAAVSSQVEGE